LCILGTISTSYGGAKGLRREEKSGQKNTLGISVMMLAVAASNRARVSTTNSVGSVPGSMHDLALSAALRMSQTLEQMSHLVAQPFSH
jgi:hypothetical protein